MSRAAKVLSCSHDRPRFSDFPSLPLFPALIRHAPADFPLCFNRDARDYKQPIGQQPVKSVEKECGQTQLSRQKGSTNGRTDVQTDALCLGKGKSLVIPANRAVRSKQFFCASSYICLSEMKTGVEGSATSSNFTSSALTCIHRYGNEGGSLTSAINLPKLSHRSLTLIHVEAINSEARRGSALAPRSGTVFRRRRTRCLVAEPRR